MKKLVSTICLIVLAAILSGCMEYAAGFGSGATAMTIMNNEAQENFIAAVNELNETTALIENQIDGIVLPSVKPEMTTAIASLRGREKDPVTWIALASLLTNAFMGGKYVRKS